LQTSFGPTEHRLMINAWELTAVKAMTLKYNIKMHPEEIKCEYVD